jgi:hypothetical protein
MSLLPLKSEPSEKLIFNPDTEDFTVNYNDGNGSKEYTIKALSIKLFPTDLADHIKKHLADKLYWKRGQKTNYEDDIKSIYQEIEANDQR